MISLLAMKLLAGELYVHRAAENLFQVQVTKHYAPMVVLEDCDPELQNFVFGLLHKNCVNYIRKPPVWGWRVV